MTAAVPNGSRRGLRMLAWVLWVIGLAGVTVALIVGIPEPTWVVTASDVSQFAGVLVLGSVGLLLATRRVENPLGWVFLVGFVLIGLDGALSEYLSHGDPDQGLATQAQWLFNWLWVPLVGVLAIYPLLLFPDGRFQSPAWRRLGWVGAAVIVAMSAGFAFGSAEYSDPEGNPAVNPYAPSRGGVVFDVLRNVGAFGLILLVLVALIGLFRRFRRGDDVVRAQLKWFFAGGAVWFCFLAYPGEHGDGGLIDVFIGIALAALPAAIGVAVLRYHLYEIDRIISRTTSYAIVTGLVLATYAVVVTVVLRILPDKSNLAVAVATLTAASIARPAVRRVQALVDRRFDRTRYSQQQTVEAFGKQLRTVLHPDDVSVQLVATVRDTLAPSHVGLWVQPSRDRIAT